MDIVNATTRSRMMSSIRGKDTKPEVLLRRKLHAAGLRFRLHVRGLPGRPDIVLPRYKAALLVHGCFWHRHKGCAKKTNPASNVAVWKAKFAENVARDARVRRTLRRAGWRVAVVWECALDRKRVDGTVRQLINWIHSNRGAFETSPESGKPRTSD